MAEGADNTGVSGGEPASTLRDPLAAAAAERSRAARILSPGAPEIAATDLLGRVDAIGSFLREHRLDRSARVAVSAGLGPDAGVALLGVASYATCVPVNPGAPAELEDVLVETGARALLAPLGATDAEHAAARRTGVGLLERPPDLRAADEFPPGLPAADDPAFILRTSGTTRRPKLVPATHRQLLARATAARELMRLGPDDRGLCPMTLCYGQGLYTGLLIPILTGGSTVLPPRFDEATFVRCLEELSPTWYTAGPAHQRAIANWMRGRPAEAARAAIRLVRSASGSMGADVRAELESLFRAPVLETYGTSEAGMIASPDPFGPRKDGTAGSAAGVEIAIIDAEGAEVAAGATGEIVVRGPTVFSGYEGDPELNRRSFIDGWHRTGDRGSLDEDGFLTIAGRLDEVINRGGEKISPAEVEAALAEHTDVTGVVAFGVPHRTLGQDVAAAVTLARGEASEADLRAHLASQLAPFKVPRRILAIPELPVGPTGKPPRARMAELLGLAGDAETPRQAAGSTAPGSLAGRIAGLFGQTLEREGVGAEEDFFDSGGDSLSGVELLAAIKEEFGVELGLDELVEAPTPRMLARRIEGGARDGRSGSHTGLPGVNTGGASPPLFSVGGRAGSTLRLLLVGRAIDPEQPVLGLEPPGMDWGAAGIRTLAEMAAHYLRRVREVQPRGPYRLLGSSFGGLVVFEMARQLERDGEQAEFVGMIDNEPAPFRWQPERDGLPERNLASIDRVPEGPAGGPEGAASESGRRIAAAQTDAGLGYVIENPLEAPLTFFHCAGEGVPAGGDRRALWPQATNGEYRLLALPGLHARMHQEPQFSALAEALRACLRGEPPAGLDPSKVFERSYTLERSEDGEVIRDQAGRTFPVEPGAMRGRVRRTRRTRGKVLVRGWASDPERERPGGEVLAFVDGAYAGYSVCGVPSERLGRRHPGLRHAGFRIRLGGVPSNGAVPTPRVFALAPGGEAAELRSG